MSEVLSGKDINKLLPILEYLDSHNRISPEEGRKITGKSAATVRRYLGMLSDAGVLEVEGSTSNILYWRKIKIH